MNQIPFKHLKYLPHLRTFPIFTEIHGGVPRRLLNTHRPILGDIENRQVILETKKTILSSAPRLEHGKFKFFQQKPKQYPIKCKVRTNEFGEKVAEPYAAKEPSCIYIEPITKDFTMIPDEKCEKLQGKIFTFPDDLSETSNHSKKVSHNQFDCPNALTKFLKKKRQCQDVFRGSESIETCKKPDVCASAKKDVYTGRDCALDPKIPCCDCKEPKAPQTKAKKTLGDLISKLKSGKFKTSGYVNEELINEALSKLTDTKNLSVQWSSFRSFGLKGLSTCDKKFGNKFGFQNKQFSTRNINQIDFPYFHGRSLVIFGWNAIIKSFENMKGKKTEAEETKCDAVSVTRVNKCGKTFKHAGKTKSTNRVKRRKRRSRYWFSKIPLEPNVKGSVIFVNDSDQILEDPCCILSANFSNSQDYLPLETAEDEPDGSVNEVVDFVVEKLKSTSGTLEYTDGSSTSRISDDSKDDELVKQEKTSERNQFPAGPMIRQTKISKLDNTTTSFTTSILPQKVRPKKKRIRKRDGKSSNTKDHSITSSSKLDQASRDLYKRSFSDCLDKTRRTTTKSDTGHQEQELHRAASSEFSRNVKNEPESDSSFVKIKAAAQMFESGDEMKDFPGEKEMIMASLMNGMNLLSPGTTRPVTQKIAYLDIPKTGVSTPISNAWKNSSVRRMTSLKGKNFKKKTAGISNDLNFLESKDNFNQQYRMKSSWKSALSWKSRCECEKKPCPNKKKDYNEKSNKMLPLPVDWDYDAKAPEELLKRLSSWECPTENIGCPITSEDMKNGPPCKKPPSLSALNRCNLDECQNRLRCRRPVSKCRTVGKKHKPVGAGK
ncbi:hypothetical protein HHI36_021376 [Cryptolaemus montrouzieri]|uniref:Uncharacterized protein n=1 Tax=Cryptolaemus montrouzieri TaxID=559131 RepID=A0ABD2MWK9_9CUCU